jgi:hypothetical protein
VKNWAHRINQSNQRQRAAKTELLPLPKVVRDALSLEYHLHLEALRVGVGSIMALQMLMRVAMATNILSDLGYGDRGGRAFEDYLEAANRTLSLGNEGSFRFDCNAYRIFASLLCHHDDQLEMAPVRAIDIVARRLEGIRQ